jgi:hypothetical protein
MRPPARSAGVPPAGSKHRNDLPLVEPVGRWLHQSTGDRIGLAPAMVAAHSRGHSTWHATRVLLRSLAAVDELVRSCWSRETCDPVEQEDWSATEPARGQCGVTALVLQDLLGGELLVAEVRNEDGTRQGVHYWNRLRRGLEIDLTRGQFARGETVGEPEVVPRPPDISAGRLSHQYRLLSERITRGLSV